METIRQKFQLLSPITEKAFFAGMECEVEAVEDYRGQGLNAHGWNITEDGSLRNNGREFISTPMVLDKLLQAFQLLHTKDPSVDRKNQYLFLGDNPFSERTSIHVHVNCLDLTLDQVKAITMWYALFEPYFFKMVKPEREHNIHCVQLNQTSLPEHYKRPFVSMVNKWSKYTALNLLPLKELGTIEFRHHHGTADFEEVSRWLNTIKNLWTYGKEVPLTRQIMASEEKQREGFEFIFRDAPVIAGLSATLPYFTADSSIDVKLGLI